MVAGALARQVPEDPAADDFRGAATPTPDLAAVYEAHFRYVWRCLRSLGVHDAQLDDALQDVFVVVQKKLAGFDGRAELRMATEEDLIRNDPDTDEVRLHTWTAGAKLGYEF